MRHGMQFVIVVAATILMSCGGYTAPADRVTNTSGGGGGGGGGAANSVDVLDNQFNPDSTSVAVGETVTWTWAGYAVHNVTFTDRTIGDSGDQMSGTFKKAFATAGTYAFHCTHHPGMMGTIVVH